MTTINTNSTPKLKTMRLPSENRPPRSMLARVALLMRGVAETMFKPIKQIPGRHGSGSQSTPHKTELNGKGTYRPPEPKPLRSDTNLGKSLPGQPSATLQSFGTVRQKCTLWARVAPRHTRERNAGFNHRARH